MSHRSSSLGGFSGASQGPPRSLPGASQEPPRSLPGASGASGASQKPAGASQKPPRSLLGASRSISGASQGPPGATGASGASQEPSRSLPGASQELLKSLTGASQKSPRGLLEPSGAPLVPPGAQIFKNLSTFEYFLKTIQQSGPFGNFFRFSNRRRQSYQKPIAF